MDLERLKINKITITINPETIPIRATVLSSFSGLEKSILVALKIINANAIIEKMILAIFIEMIF